MTFDTDLSEPKYADITDLQIWLFWLLNKHICMFREITLHVVLYILISISLNIDLHPITVGAILAGAELPMSQGISSLAIDLVLLEFQSWTSSHRLSLTQSYIT